MRITNPCGSAKEQYMGTHNTYEGRPSIDFLLEEATWRGLSEQITKA